MPATGTVPAQIKQLTVQNLGILVVRRPGKILCHSWDSKCSKDLVPSRLWNGIILGKALKPQPTRIRGVAI